MPKALLGLHDGRRGEDEIFTDGLVIELDMEGYEYERVRSVDEMLRAMGLEKGGMVDDAPRNPFDMYVMDVNLGCPCGEDYRPAATVYQHVKKQVEAGEAKFMAVAANSAVVRKAQESGIPCCEKTGLAIVLDEWFS
jgi:hypothetical protein